MKTSLAALVGLAALAASAPSFAHHSTVAYDMSRTIEVKGVVKEFEPQNPHMILRVVVSDAKGVHTISFEGQSVSNMYRLGYRRGMINVGDTIRVFYAPLRTGEEGGFFNRVITAHGKSIGAHATPASPL